MAARLLTTPSQWQAEDSETDAGSPDCRSTISSPILLSNVRLQRAHTSEVGRSPLSIDEGILGPLGILNVSAPSHDGPVDSGQQVSEASLTRGSSK